MSWTNLALPSMRGVNGVTFGPSSYSGLGPWWGSGPMSSYWPLQADSPNPMYATPNTKYGTCDCTGGAVSHNACNYQQNGYVPQCLANGMNCRCVNMQGTDSGCFNKKGAACQ